MTLLESIWSPRDVKALTPAQLTVLADEIRGFLIEAVSRNGGHLGPNLGVVELTIALHRVFDSPADPIVWDTGHQSYVHKLLTGRMDGFSRLRQQRRGFRLPEPGRVRARLGRELARLDQPVVRRRAGQGAGPARRDEAAGRRRDRRRRPDRRHGLGGAEQHRRGQGPARGHRGQRQRPVLPAHHRRSRRSPRLGPGLAAVRAGARPGQDHALAHPAGRPAAVRDAARDQEGPEGRPAAAGAVRGSRAEVPRPGRRPRRAGARARARPGQGVRRSRPRARDHAEGPRLRAGRGERRGLPAPGPARRGGPDERRGTGRERLSARAVRAGRSGRGLRSSPTSWRRSARAGPTWWPLPRRCCTPRA